MTWVPIELPQAAPLLLNAMQENILSAELADTKAICAMYGYPYELLGSPHPSVKLSTLYDAIEFSRDQQTERYHRSMHPGGLSAGQGARWFMVYNDLMDTIYRRHSGHKRRPGHPDENTGQGVSAGDIIHD